MNAPGIPRSRRGATTVEYVLVLSVVVFFCLVGASKLFQQTSRSFGQLEGGLVAAPVTPGSEASLVRQPVASSELASPSPLGGLLVVATLAGVSVVFYLAYLHVHFG